MMRIAVFICSLVFALPASAKDDALNVFAAASLTDVMDDLIRAYEETTGADVQGIYAGSSALARQIDSGAPAHLFVSANIAWMDYLEEQDLIVADTRQNVAQNRLVTIAPKDTPAVDPSTQKNLRVVIGEPLSVPVGMYAVQALKAMGDYPHIKDGLLFAENARSVLTWVERGEVDYGVVYATDANVSNKVRVVAEFPATAHDPILYPAAATAFTHPAAIDFLSFLTSADGQDIFAQHGFVPAPFLPATSTAQDPNLQR